MLKVLKDGKVPVLKFECSLCGSVFIASVDECSEKVVMSVPFYEAQCPKCCKWVLGKDTGVTSDQKPEIEKLCEDILKEIQLEESLPEDVEV